MSIRSCWMAVVGLLVSSQLLAATITVTTVADDNTPNDGSVSLREAIQAINNGSAGGDPDIISQNPGVFGVNDTINFNITAAGTLQTISVGSTGNGALPALIKPMTINGYSEPGASVNTLANGDNAVLLIQIDGANAGPNADGLLVGATGAGSTIMGLIINRFSLNGIELQGSGTVSGNFVGVNSTGMVSLPNQNDGIHISNSSSSLIGGTTPAARNIVSGNNNDGIHIVGSTGAPATGNLVQGNFVGVNAAGTGSVGLNPNPIAPGIPAGNFLHGIEISGGNANTIGGSTASARNVVGFNIDGIALDNGAQGNVVQGNFVGVGADGVTAAGNALHGISLRSDDNLAPPLGPGQANEPATSGNIIGLNPNSGFSGLGNLVEFNGTAGIVVSGNPLPNNATPIQNSGNSLLGNAIFENGRSSPATLVGIDLSNGFVYPKDDGSTANDSKGHGAANDPNNFQNFPVLTSATITATGVQIAGTLTQSVSPGTTFRIEFFSNSPDPLGGKAEGQTFLGATNATTNGTGAASFAPTFNVSVAAGAAITATATSTTADPSAQPGAVNLFNTSEFSAAIPLGAVPLSIAKAFSAATIPLNGTTTLTFTIQNPSASAETGVAFTDSLPVGLVVAVTPNLTNTCGGTATAAAGSGSVALSAGTLAGTASCTVSVTVRGAFAGVNNNSVQVSSNEGGVGNTANASITVVAPPTIAKAFGAASIPVGSVTSLTFTITNPNAATTLTGVGFTDTLPAGLVIATPNALTGSCGGGTITATAGSGSISLTGAALAGSASCTFSVNVTGMSAGVKSNTTGAVTSVEGGTGGTASAIVTVGAVLPPTIAKVFGAGTVALNGMTSLSFTLTNPNAASTLTGIGFTDTLPAGLVVATPNGLIGTCGGGVITATAGSGSISLTGAALAGSASCTFSVNVVGTSAGTELNTTGAVTSVEGGTGGTASAGIVVVGAAPTAATIPTLQQWALVLLGLILAAAAGISLCSPRKE